MTNWLAGYSESIRLLQDSEKKVQCSRQDENFGNNSGQVLLFLHKHIYWVFNRTDFYIFCIVDNTNTNLFSPLLKTPPRQTNFLSDGINKSKVIRAGTVYNAKITHSI